MKKAALLFVATLAAWMARRALARQPEVITLLWAIIGLSATASTPGSPKARSVEHRLQGIIAGVGAASASASNAQTAANNAQATANAAQTAANNAQATANNALNVANAALPRAGGTITGSLTVNGNLSVGGTVGTGGTVTSGFDVRASNALYIAGTRIVPGQGEPGSPGVNAPATYNTTWGNNVNAAINGIIISLRNSGIMS